MDTLQSFLRMQKRWQGMHRSDYTQARPYPDATCPLNDLRYHVLKHIRQNKEPVVDGIPTDVWKSAQNDLKRFSLSCEHSTLVGEAWESGRY